MCGQNANLCLQIAILSLKNAHLCPKILICAIKMLIVGHKNANKLLNIGEQITKLWP